ncbi:MAG: UDP-N-acetylmuramoyl-tripeptide--D-alanyl-D-alanine ligase [Clostridiales Family XIII bacterium]|nr:UDP-N-acetylmuramoyl-tripeptide--D-alanyl-D-alanine ligase [Clostridiales Family XIII bacterium]
MARFSVGEIAEAVGGAFAHGAALADTAVSGISTDTRTLARGAAFFALAGENHDAHDHLAEAVGKGAGLLVVSDASKAPAGFAGAVLKVGDTLRAYQELAAYCRKRLNPLVIAVTGSVGKTTLKDMIACILSASYRVVSTEGNLNNQIGLPRTILGADEGTEILVLEMGMARAGEIERLAEIARPGIAAITNIGVSHRENFDSGDGILYAKYEIAAFLGAGDALVIDAANSEALSQLSGRSSREKGYAVLRVAQAGTEAAKSADYAVSDVRFGDGCDIALFEIEDAASGGKTAFSIPASGAYVGVTAALAAAVCARTGVSLQASARALKNLARTPHRLETIRKGGILVIDDTYNASPDSAKSGLEFLGIVPAERRIAALADMNELGGESEILHREVGAAAAAAGTDILFAYGEKARAIAAGAAGAPGIAEIYSYGADEKAALVTHLREIVRPGDAVYIKGSRSMKMEEAVRALTEDAKWHI